MMRWKNYLKTGLALATPKYIYKHCSNEAIALTLEEPCFREILPILPPPSSGIHVVKINHQILKLA